MVMDLCAYVCIPAHPSYGKGAATTVVVEPRATSNAGKGAAPTVVVQPQETLAVGTGTAPTASLGEGQQTEAHTSSHGKGAVSTAVQQQIGTSYSGKGAVPTVVGQQQSTSYGEEGAAPTVVGQPTSHPGYWSVVLKMPPESTRCGGCMIAVRSRQCREHRFIKFIVDECPYRDWFCWSPILITKITWAWPVCSRYNGHECQFDSTVVANVFLNHMTAKKLFWAFCIELAEAIDCYDVRILCGDFSTKLFRVVPTLRDLGITIDLAAVYPSYCPFVGVKCETCAIFLIGGVQDLHQLFHSDHILFPNKYKHKPLWPSPPGVYPYVAVTGFHTWGNGAPGPLLRKFIDDEDVTERPPVAKSIRFAKDVLDTFTETYSMRLPLLFRRGSRILQPASALWSSRALPPWQQVLIGPQVFHRVSPSDHLPFNIRFPVSGYLLPNMSKLPPLLPLNYSDPVITFGIETVYALYGGDSEDSGTEAPDSDEEALSD